MLMELKCLERKNRYLEETIKVLESVEILESIGVKDKRVKNLENLIQSVQQENEKLTADIGQLKSEFKKSTVSI